MRHFVLAVLGAVLLATFSATAAQAAPTRTGAAADNWPVVRAISKTIAVAKSKCRDYKAASPIYNTCSNITAHGCVKYAPRRGACTGDFVLSGNGRHAYCASAVHLYWTGSFMRVTKPKPVFHCIPI